MRTAVARQLIAGLLMSSCVARVLAEDEVATGLSTSLDYAGEILRNLSGGMERGSVFTGLASLNLDFVGDGWSGHAKFYDPHGRSLTDRYVGDFSVVSNIDTVHKLRMQEAWLQKDCNGASLRVGMLASDAEFWIADYGALFLSSVFGAPSVISGNLPNPNIFPLAALGARVAFDLGDGRTVRVSWQDGDAGDPARDNPHGFDVDFGQGTLALAEYQSTQEHDDGMIENIKLSAFMHSGDFVDADGALRKREFGVMAIVDRALGENLGWFARAGVASRSRSVVPFSVESGLNWKSVFRDEDTVGFALAYVSLNDESGNLLDVPDLEREAILELTYDLALTEHVSLQPDLQYIVDAGGARSNGNAFVAGVRLKVYMDMD